MTNVPIRPYSVGADGSGITIAATRQRQSRSADKAAHKQLCTEYGVHNHRMNGVSTEYVLK